MKYREIMVFEYILKSVFEIKNALDIFRRCILSHQSILPGHKAFR